MAGPPARSLLFVPATRPDRFDKALASGADLVIVDLEDAVKEDEKDVARERLAAYLSKSPASRLLVRINPLTTRHAEQDLALCARFDGVAGIVLPKADTSADVDAAASANKPVWPIIESARALHNLPAVAAARGVVRLAFGSLDFALDLGLDLDSAAGQLLLDQARFAVLLHTRLAGLEPPLDGVFPDIANEAGVRHAAERARDMGFGGSLCIHPRQVGVLNDVFSPSPAQIEWATRVLDLAQDQSGAFQMDGRMVDAPVIERARRLLSRAGAITG